MRQKTLSLLLLSLLLPLSLSAQTFRPRIMSGLRLTMLPGQSQDPMQLINSSGTILALLNNAGRFEVAVITNAGACTDAVFSIGTVGDGALCVDTSAGAFYFRTGGAWSAIPPGGITSLNGLTGAIQTFSTGTAGTNFGISSSGSVHTFDLPDASATARGLVTTANQTFTGTKTTPIWNASTGFRIGGAAASGNVPRGNGTNFVSAQLAFSDLAGTANSVGASELNDGECVNGQVFKRTGGSWACGSAGAKVAFNFFTNATIFDPADSTTYHFTVDGSPNSTANHWHYRVPITGNVTRFDLVVRITSTLGSSELVTASVRLRDAVTACSFTLAYNVAEPNGSTTCSSSVTAGDFIEVRLVTPAWASNPFDVTHRATILIEE